MGLPLPCLMLVTEPSPHLPKIIGEAVAGGVNAVQWREKGSGAGAVPEALSVGCGGGRGGVPVMVNGQWEAALTAGARHVHLPEKSLLVGVVRWRMGGNGLIGKSVHSVESALKAQADGADYVIAGTIFASSSHPDIAPAGLEFLRKSVRRSRFPFWQSAGYCRRTSARVYRWARRAWPCCRRSCGAMTRRPSHGHIGRQ